MEEVDTIISIRVPKRLKGLMEKYVLLDIHMNESEFIRDAIRQKIKKDTPQLYKEFFGNGNDKK